MVNERVWLRKRKSIGKGKRDKEREKSEKERKKEWVFRIPIQKRYFVYLKGIKKKLEKKRDMKNAILEENQKKLKT